MSIRHSQATDNSAARYSFTPALVMLGIAIVINYVDRGNLSIAAPIVKNELGLTATELGILFSAFFYTYTALQFGVGRLVDQLGASRVLVAGLLLWSIATMGMGFAGGFASLLLLRLLLGVGESVAFPCTSKLIAQHVSAANRGLANGVITAGLKLGPSIGAFSAGLLSARYGWRPVFWGMGAASLLWLPFWLIWKPPARIDEISRSSRVGYLDVLRQRSFWGCSAGHFCFNYLSYFLLTWLPFYLAHERHFSQEALSRYAGIYYLVDAAAALLTGVICDQLIRIGARATVIRKGASAIGSGIAATALFTCAFADAKTFFLWLLAAGVGSGMAGCGVFLFAQTLAGPRAVGQWSALQNGFGNFAGLTAPAITGLLVDRTGNFFIAFALVAAVCVAGAFLWIFGIRFEAVDWDRCGQKSGG
jgi:MFS family permease